MRSPDKNRISAMRIAIIGSVILGVVQMILLGAAYQRRTATSNLILEQIALEENIESLIKVNQDQVDQLQLELDLLQAEITELEASFPELGAHFDIYGRGQELAIKTNLDLQEIAKLGEENIDTYAGLVIEQQFNIEVLGSIADCIEYIGELEQAGRETLAMNSIFISPENSSCSYDISLIGYSAAGGE